MHERKDLPMLERLKPYKHVSPMETINTIRNILFKNEIFVIETSQKREPLTGVCSCRIILGDEELRDLNIGANGKGMDARFALASAYAEFIERLQNGAILWKVLGSPPSLPNEKNIGDSCFKEATQKIYKLAYGEKNCEMLVDAYVSGVNSNKVIEFKEYQTNEPLLFPVELLNHMTGSNGMAAGNTILEAIIQGLSEVFERYATHILFSEKHIPPRIEEEYFTETDILTRLKNLNRAGISFEILDCSLGLGLPVIGLLIKKNGKYHIHFGADPSPITALERCLTETFQGRDINELPLYEPLREDSDRLTLFQNEKKQYTDSTGQVPEWLLCKSNNAFCGFSHPVTRSDEEDMDYYLELLSRLEKKLYVCEVSTLGFPTVRVYVPGMTENHCMFPEECTENLFPLEIKEYVRRLPLLSDGEFYDLATHINVWLNIQNEVIPEQVFLNKSFDNLKFAMPAGSFTGRLIDGKLLLAAIYYRGGYENIGFEFFQRYIKEKEITTSESEILQIRLKSKSLFFLPTEWASCPDCLVCRARNLCCQNEINRFKNKINLLLDIGVSQSKK